MLSRRSFLSKALLLAAGAGAIWLVRDRILWSEPQPIFETGGSSGWLDFASSDQPLPTFRATVQGREVNALLDSGAQYSVIDEALAEELALSSTFAPMVAVGIGGQPQMGRGVTADVQVGDLELSQLKAAVLALGPIATAQGLSAPLILGQDVLGQVIADIDFPRRRLRLAAADAHQLPDGAFAAPVRSKGRALAAQVQVGATTLEAVVDTGASVVLALSRDVAEEAGLLANQKPRYGSSVVLGGQMAGQIVTAETIRFADQTFDEVDVMIYPTQRLPGFPRGLLGVGALERFRAILDHAEGTMHLAA